MSLLDKLRDPRRAPTPFSIRPELLLCAKVVRPLHGVVPRLILGQAWWDETRRAAYRKTGFRCAACGAEAADAEERQALEGHEVYSVDYDAGRQIYIETVALCHYCHSFIHHGRLQALVDKGGITKTKFNAVMRHGRRVLREAGLVKPEYADDYKPREWNRWRLVLFGKEYPPVHENYAAWLAHWHPDEEVDDA